MKLNAGQKITVENVISVQTYGPLVPGYKLLTSNVSTGMVLTAITVREFIRRRNCGRVRH